MLHRHTGDQLNNINCSVILGIIIFKTHFRTEIDLKVSFIFGNYSSLDC